MSNKQYFFIHGYNTKKFNGMFFRDLEDTIDFMLYKNIIGIVKEKTYAGKFQMSAVVHGPEGNFSTDV